MYDIVFMDIPHAEYQGNDELNTQIELYRNDCEIIIHKETGVAAAEKKFFYSMGILCLSSYLKTYIENIKIGYIHFDINMDEFKEYVENAKVIAFSTMTVTMNIILNLANAAHNIKPDVKIVLGGYHASYFARELIEEYEFIDCIFLYEGEQSLLEYMLHKKKECISGIAFRNEAGAVTVNEFEKYLEGIRIPIPDYSLILDNLQDFNIHLSTMRGCIGACNFCVNHSYWSCPRAVPSERIVEELLYLKEYLPKGTIIHLIDNIFTYDKRRLKNLYCHMQEKHLLGYFNFECDTLSTLVDEEIVNLLEKIGVFKICLGIEDCNEKVLRISNKKAMFTDSVRAAQTIKKYSDNICVYAYWLIGLPGSTIETMEENIFWMRKLIEENQVDLISPKIFIPYPGTQFFNNPEVYGIHITSYHWDLYERRNPPFPYHYDKVSDKELYRYLLKALKVCHEAYERKNKGMEALLYIDAEKNK